MTTTTSRVHPEAISGWSPIGPLVSGIQAVKLSPYRQVLRGVGLQRFRPYPLSGQAMVPFAFRHQVSPVTSNIFLQCWPIVGISRYVTERTYISIHPSVPVE